MNSLVAASSCVTRSSNIDQKYWQSSASARIGWRSISPGLSSDNNLTPLEQHSSTFSPIRAASMLIIRPPTLREYTANFDRRLKHSPLLTTAELPISFYQ